MPGNPKVQQWRTSLGTVLVILAGIGWFIVVSQGLFELLPSHAKSPQRLIVSGLVCAALLVVAAAMLRDRSIVWQSVLQGTAAGGLVAGVNLLIRPLFGHWQVLLGQVGAVGVLSLGLGAGAAALMRNWQPKPQHRHAHHSAVAERSSALQPGTVGSVVEEFKQGTWFANARSRSVRRKSPWNLLLILILPLWLAIWWGTIELMWWVHAAWSQRSGSTVSAYWMKGLGAGPMTLAQFLLVFLLLFPALTTAAVVGNFLIYRIPAARRAMDAEDRAFPGTEYATAQKTLIGLTFKTLPWVLVIVLGATWFL